MDFPDTLVRRARTLERAVYDAADELEPTLMGQVSNPYAEALRAAAVRLIPGVWQWRIEVAYGGSAVFFITGYSGE